MISYSLRGEKQVDKERTLNPKHLRTPLGSLGGHHTPIR